MRRRTDAPQTAVGRGEPVPGLNFTPASIERLDTTLGAAVAATRDDAYAAQ